MGEAVRLSEQLNRKSLETFQPITRLGDHLTPVAKQVHVSPSLVEEWGSNRTLDALAALGEEIRKIEQSSSFSAFARGYVAVENHLGALAKLDASGLAKRMLYVTIHVMRIDEHGSHVHLDPLEDRVNTSTGRRYVAYLSIAPSRFLRTEKDAHFRIMPGMTTSLFIEPWIIDSRIPEEEESLDWWPADVDWSDLKE